MATQARHRLLTAEEFLRIKFGPDMKAELDNGVIRMMAGGTLDHGRVQMNLYRYLGLLLRGSGCRPYGSDVAIRTHDKSIRFPDLSIHCGQIESGKVLALDDPRVVVEILSPSTREDDLGVKLDEYRALASLDYIAFVDPDTETVQLYHRDADRQWVERDARDLAFATLGVTVPHSEIFAHD